MLLPLQSETTQRLTISRSIYLAWNEIEPTPFPDHMDNWIHRFIQHSETTGRAVELSSIVLNSPLARTTVCFKSAEPQFQEIVDVF